MESERQGDPISTLFEDILPPRSAFFVARFKRGQDRRSAFEQTNLRIPALRRTPKQLCKVRPLFQRVNARLFIAPNITFCRVWLIGGQRWPDKGLAR